MHALGSKMKHFLWILLGFYFDLDFHVLLKIGGFHFELYIFLFFLFYIYICRDQLRLIYLNIHLLCNYLKATSGKRTDLDGKKVRFWVSIFYSFHVLVYHLHVYFCNNADICIDEEIANKGNMLIFVFNTNYILIT